VRRRRCVRDRRLDTILLDTILGRAIAQPLAGPGVERALGLGLIAADLEVKNFTDGAVRA
jgi:hypothetical protein